MSVTDADFLREVHEGLSRPQKTLSPKWLYDHRGSELFEEITEVPEYYPTRTERSIFETAFPAVAARCGTKKTVVEYGSGSSRKTGPLLDAVGAEIYVPLDISETFLRDSAEAIGEAYPHVDVHPVVADFTAPLRLPDEIGPPRQRLGFFPGSTIGNLEAPAAARFLDHVRQSLGEGAHFLLSADLIKDPAILEAAYDDKGGVTAAFNLNLLTRMNRELGADFDDGRYAHRAVFNEEKARVEMHIVSLADQTVTIGDRSFSFAEGETLHTESSHKFTVDGMERLAQGAGFRCDTYWTDEKDWFGVFLLAG